MKNTIFITVDNGFIGKNLIELLIIMQPKYMWINLLQQIIFSEVKGSY